MSPGPPAGLHRERRELPMVRPTYSTFARGGDAQLGAYTWLDMTALGRQEDREQPEGRSDGAFMPWTHRHDEY